MAFVLLFFQEMPNSVFLVMEVCIIISVSFWLILKMIFRQNSFFAQLQNNHDLLKQAILKTRSLISYALLNLSAVFVP